MRESTKIKARHAEINPVACPYCAREWRTYANESFFNHMPRHWRVYSLKPQRGGNYLHRCQMVVMGKVEARGTGPSPEMAEDAMEQAWAIKQEMEAAA